MQRNFEVSKTNAKGVVQTRIISINSDECCIRNLKRGKIQKEFAFDEVTLVEEDVTSLVKLFIYFRNRHRYELDMRTEHDRKELAQCLRSIMCGLELFRKFAASQESFIEQTIKTGLVMKKGKLKWAPRSLVLTSTAAIIVYRETSKQDFQTPPLNIIPYLDTTYEQESGGVLLVSTRLRTFRFRFASSEECEEWHVAINKVVMKVVGAIKLNEADERLRSNYLSRSDSNRSDSTRSASRSNSMLSYDGASRALQTNPFLEDSDFDDEQGAKGEAAAFDMDLSDDDEADMYSSPALSTFGQDAVSRSTSMEHAPPPLVGGAPPWPDSIPAVAAASWLEGAAGLSPMSGPDAGAYDGVDRMREGGGVAKDPRAHPATDTDDDDDDEGRAGGGDTSVGTRVLPCAKAMEEEGPRQAPESTGERPPQETPPGRATVAQALECHELGVMDDDDGDESAGGLTDSELDATLQPVRVSMLASIKSEMESVQKDGSLSVTFDELLDILDSVKVPTEKSLVECKEWLEEARHNVKLCNFVLEYGTDAISAFRNIFDREKKQKAAEHAHGDAERMTGLEHGDVSQIRESLLAKVWECHLTDEMDANKRLSTIVGCPDTSEMVLALCFEEVHRLVRPRHPSHLPVSDAQ